MSLLEARGLVKQYGRRLVVNGVDIQIDAGEIVGLLGPNGAGKTTTFRMMVGMIAPKSGSVFFNRHEITDLPMYQRARLGLGYLAQDSSVFRKLTVEQNLYAILEMMTTRRGKPYQSTRRERRERVDELLEQFGLTPRRKSVSSTLSGGERRRLEIARCLVSEPMLIMLDEPFTGIDPKTVGDIQEIVKSLRQTGIGVLITDHHVAETLRITDRSYLIADGKMLCHGTPQEIVNDSNARRVYLGENFIAAGIAEDFSRPQTPTSQPAISPSPVLPTPHQRSIKSLLENEEMFDLVERLAGDDYLAVAAQIRARRQAAVAPLIRALERRDRNLRLRAHRVLCDVVDMEIPFNPDADEINRTRQIALIRAHFEQRQAG